MKLIIDIPEEYLKTIKAIPDETSSLDMLLIKYGTPFDSVIEDIKTEIKEKYDSIPYRNTEYDDAWIDALEWVLESVIDKHISGKENNET